MTDVIDMSAIKARLKSTWMSGDYGAFAKYMEPGAIELLNRWEIPVGSQMLDVACGAGQLSIPAAKAGIKVTGIDIASNWIEQAKSRASAEGLNIRFDEGDAEEMPYADNSFDVVISLVGAMFAPRPDRISAELVRVSRSNGRIIMINWTPTGFVGQMFKVISKYVVPPPSVPSVLLWGDEISVHERLDRRVKELKMVRGNYPAWVYPFPVPDVVEFFRLNYGPIYRAFTVLDSHGQANLRSDLERVFSDYNLASDDDKTSLEAEYLEVSAICI